jgi:hypothetical protein
VGGTPLEVWLTILKELVYYGWTGLQADRHEMEKGHATVQVAALVNSKTGIEWKEGKAHEGRIGRVIPWKMPSTPCAATQNFHFFCH